MAPPRAQTSSPAAQDPVPTASLIASDDGRCAAEYEIIGTTCVHSTLVAQRSHAELVELVEAYRRGAAPPAVPEPRGQEARKAPHTVVSGVTVERVEDPYTISGNTVAELWASMRRAGDILPGRGRVPGRASREIGWRFGYTRSAAGCRVAPVALKIVGKIKIPHWYPLASATPGLDLKWKRYLENVKVHENGHVDISVRQANLIHKQLEALPPAPTCEQAKALANELGSRLMQEEGPIQDAYDEETQRGALQGYILAE